MLTNYQLFLIAKNMKGLGIEDQLIHATLESTCLELVEAKIHKAIDQAMESTSHEPPRKKPSKVRSA